MKLPEHSLWHIRSSMLCVPLEATGTIQLRPDPAHLSWMFKRAFGVIPARWRALEAIRTP
jgi:hypothetical protein